MKNFDLSLYLVTDRELSLKYPLSYIVEEAVKGGVTIVQLREKKSNTREFYELALQMKRLLKAYNVPLIINDRLDIALASDADGLHIGQSDLPCDVARRILGKNKIIGLSVETLEQAYDADIMDVDYIGISPVFSTPTKADTGRPFGLEGVRKIAGFTKHKTVAIGGVNAGNARQVIERGADGIAVVSAIISTADPRNAAFELKNIVNEAKKSEK